MIYWSTDTWMMVSSFCSTWHAVLKMFCEIISAEVSDCFEES